MDKTVYNALFTKAANLVKEHIRGHRKGMPDVPNYTHSLRVADLLTTYGFSEEICLAGLLHDVVEDGNVSLEELVRMGFPNDIVEIVHLCTHDVNISNKDHRWIVMVMQLVKADSMAAWAVKLADITDNLTEAHMLSKDREKLMREVKAPVLLSASEHLLGKTQLWQNLSISINSDHDLRQSLIASWGEEWVSKLEKQGWTLEEISQIENGTKEGTVFQMGFTNAPEWAVQNLPRPLSGERHDENSQNIAEPSALSRTEKATKKLIALIPATGKDPKALTKEVIEHVERKCTDKQQKPEGKVPMKPYVAFVFDQHTFTYHVHLMNPTDVAYAKVVSETGGNASYGDEVMQTTHTELSKSNRGSLPKQSTMFIEYGNEFDLDWEIWYWLDLYRAGHEQPWKVMLSIPKYGDGYKPEYLRDGMLVGLTGMRIELRERK